MSHIASVLRVRGMNLKKTMRQVALPKLERREWKGDENVGDASRQPFGPANGAPEPLSGSRARDEFDATARRLPEDKRRRPAPSEDGEVRGLDAFDRGAKLGELADPWTALSGAGPGPQLGVGDGGALVREGTATPENGDGKASSSKEAQQSDGAQAGATTGTLLTLIGAVGNTQPGQVGLRVLMGAGTRPEIAGAAGAVVTAGVLGYQLGTAIDGLVTDLLGQSLGGYVYDKTHPDTPAETPGGMCGGDEKMPDPTGSGAVSPSTPAFAEVSSQRPSLASAIASRRSQASQPGEGRAPPSRFTVDRKELLTAGVARNTDGKTQPTNDAGGDGAQFGVDAPRNETPDGNVDPVDQDGGLGPRRPNE